jgi:hypothetical protein
VSAAATATQTDEATGEPLLDEALADLGADFEELLFLARSGEAELAEAADELARARLRVPTRELLRRQNEDARRRHRAIAERLVALRAAADTQASRSLVDRLAGEKASLADLIRVERGLTAALRGAADWQ